MISNDIHTSKREGKTLHVYFILFFKFLIAGMVVHRHRGKKQKSVSLDMRKERLIESVSKALYCMDMAQSH